jgi:hypothetical protein|tara:strand:- start:274 stop:486 length:213 start_codon:yes stop_codon:yes gene_type:complete
MKDYNKLAKEILSEAEFKEGGFVTKHISQGKSNALQAIRSAVDNMSDLYDLERDDIGIISNIILKNLTGS